MAYYYNYSDADQYPPNYHYQNHHYTHNYNNNNQHNEYQYNNIYDHHYHYATPQTLAPQSYYYYSDGSNCYQASNDYYSYGHFPVVYNSVAGNSQPQRVEWEGGGVDMGLIVDQEDDDDDDEAYDDFDDYDPTPYGGGYDIVMVYGKPLPASDAICHPRSGTGSNKPVVPVNVISDQPVVVSKANVPVDDFECHNGNDHSESECEKESLCGSEMSEEVSEGDVVRLSGNDYDVPSYEGEREYEKVIVSNGDQAPNANELSSASLGFSDGLYGYLPCLIKKKNKTAVESGDYGWVGKPDEDPWKAAADFIFGSLNPYAD